MDKLQNPMDDMPLHDDPLENLKLENELIKLKLQAESGSFVHSDGNIDPRDEHQMLQQIQLMQAAITEGRSGNLYDMIGRPDFIKADALTEEEAAVELEKMQAVLAEHSFVVESKTELIPIVMYRFITEFLFTHEIDDFRVPGMDSHLVFEKFEAIIHEKMRSMANGFMWYWSEQLISDNNLVLAPEVGVYSKSRISQQEFYNKLRYYFEAYPRFHNFVYNIEWVDFDWNGAVGCGMVDGSVQYEAEAENGERTLIKGNYILFMNNWAHSMSIHNIIMPGFVW